MEKLYTVNRNKTRGDCGSDHEHLITKFRFKMKKVGKTTRLFRNDLNQIPYDYTVEVRLLAWLLSPPLESPFSPADRICLIPPPSLLYPTLWISLCSRWWRTLRELITDSICLSPFDSLRLSSWPPLSPSSLLSSLYNSMNISEWSRLGSKHKEVITG